jgi:hypothetical protein
MCCGKEYLAKSKKAKYCTDKCKDRANKSKESYKEARRTYMKKDRDANLDKYRQKDRLRYLNNREVFYHNNAKRRCQQKIASPLWMDKVGILSLYRQMRDLNKEAGYRKYHVDHIIPLFGKGVCGLHVFNNLQLLLAEDNLRKGNR